MTSRHAHMTPAITPTKKRNAMNKTRILAAAAAATIALSLAACAAPADPGGGGGDDDVLTIGFITKFPVDFYDIMVDAAKEWDANEPGAEVVFAQGKSGTDDEGEIAAIESMITQGVDAIAITPTSPNVADELQKAVDAGIPVVLIDNDIPDWDGKTAVVATDNYAGGQLAGTWLAENLPEGAKLAVLQGVLGNPSLDDRVDGMLDTLGDAADGRRDDPDRLRPDQGSRRRPGHPDREPRADRDLRRVRPAAARRARGDQVGWS